MSQETMSAIVAAIGFNDGANKGFWRIQPRDDGGQWIEMGADVLFRFRTGKGNLVVANGKGVYVGPSGRPGMARVLVADSKDGVEPGVYEIESRNLKQFKAILPGSKSEKAGARKDKFGKPIKTLEDSKLPDLNALLAGKKPITADDKRLAKGQLTPSEREAEQDGRSNSPIANLPAGFEVENPDKVKDLLRESGIDPDEFDKTSEKVSESEISSFDRADSLAKEAMESAFFGDDVPNINALLDAPEQQPKAVALTDLKPGDVVELGKYGKRTITRTEVNQDGAVDLYVDDFGSEKRVPEGPFPGEGTINVVGREESTPPAEPKKPTKPPTAPAETTPEATEGPKVPIKPEKVSAAKRRLDDGKNIPQQRFTAEELESFRKENLADLIDNQGKAVIEYTDKGRAYNPKDPNAMLNFLASKYEKAKFNDQGHLVLMREVSKENGKNIQWEIRAAILGDKKIGYMFHFKDLDTGEDQTLLHKDARDSVQSLFGKTNSPQVLADILTGKVSRKYNKNFITDVHAKDPKERAHYFALQGRTKSLSDAMKYYSNGYAERINYSDGTLLEKEVKSVFDAYKEGDYEAVADRLKASFGRIPVDERSHEEARDAIRELFSEKFPSEDKRPFGALVTTASNLIKKGLINDPEARATPWSSANKLNPIDVGMVVEYENNIGEKSIVKVIGKQRVNTSNPAQSQDGFGYGDYITIIGADGVRSSVPSTNVRILKDQNTELTELKKRVSGRRLREERGLLYNPTTLRFPGQQEVPDRVMPVDDIVPGDNFYGKDGSNLGVVIESIPIVGKDDKKGFGIMYINKDGEIKKVAVASGEERGPRVIISNKSDAPEVREGRVVTPDTAESDPDFDLDAIEFETDPNTVERPKTVGLDFNVPANAKRNAEQQLSLNDEVQKEIDSMMGELSGKLGEGWQFDSSSFSAKSYFNAGELAKLIEAARARYPDLTDSEIRTLLELLHSKQRGFFGMTKEKMIENILKEAAIFNNSSGGVQDIRFDVSLNKQSGKVELSISDKELSTYLGAISNINNFIENNPKFISMIDGTNGNQYIRIVSNPKDFQALYNSIGRSFGDRSSVLGVNISMPNDKGGMQTAILINNGSLSAGNKPDGEFGDPTSHTFVHEFGHTIGNLIAAEQTNRSRLGSNYDAAFEEFITSYGASSRDEHFADSFAKYILTGVASEAFLAFLISSGYVDNVDIKN